MNIVTKAAATSKAREHYKLTINCCRMKDLVLVGGMRLVGRWFGRMK
jgi:hypothetical protein